MYALLSLSLSLTTTVARPAWCYSPCGSSDGYGGGGGGDGGARAAARGRPLIGDSEEASAIAEAIRLSMAAAGGRSA